CRIEGDPDGRYSLRQIERISRSHYAIARPEWRSYRRRESRDENVPWPDRAKRPRARNTDRQRDAGENTRDGRFGGMTGESTNQRTKFQAPSSKQAPEKLQIPKIKLQTNPKHQIPNGR